MGNRSTIERLDQSIVDECSRLIKAGRTIDEITQALRGLDADVSRSAVGRYVKSAKKAMESYTKAQEVAKVWVDRLEAEPSGDVARLLPQMLQAVAFNTIEGMAEGEGTVKPGDIMFMAKALRDIVGTGKTNIDVELKLREVREETRRKALDDAAAAVGDTARAQGMDEAQVTFWRQQVLGVR